MLSSAITLLVAAALVTGAAAGPIQGDSADAISISARGTCASDSIQGSTIWQSNSEDFSSAKKKREMSDRIADHVVGLVDRDNVHATDHKIAARSTEHWCYDINDYNQGTTIADAYSYTAIAAGHTHLLNRHRVYSQNGRSYYPKRYYNSDNIPGIATFCANKKVFEFPVFSDGSIFGANGAPHGGLHRVIFDGCGNWCATITHKGELNNRFHECDGY